MERDKEEGFSFYPGLNLPIIGTVGRFGKYTLHALEDDSMDAVFQKMQLPEPEWIPAHITKAAEYKALNKTSMVRSAFDDVTFYLAWDMLEREFSHVPPLAQATFDEIKKHIDMSKSPGYPWTVRGITTKGQVFDQYEDYLRSAYSGENPECFWCIQLKNELRPKEKVEENKSRIFVISDLKHNIQVMRFFLPFTEWMTENWRYTFSGVGMSKYYGDWHLVFSRLNKHPNAFASDLGSCDASVPHDWLKFFLFVFMPKLLRVPTEDRPFYDRVMLFELQKFCVTIEGKLFVLTDINGSGSFLTVWINIFFTRFLAYYAWVKICGHGGSTFHKYFLENIEEVRIGDDSITTASDAIVSAFNPFNISRFLKPHIDIVWSAPTPVKLLDLDFCSQNTTIVNGFYVPYPRFRRWTGAIKWDFNKLTVPQKLSKLAALRSNEAYSSDFQLLDEICKAYIHAWEPVYHGKKDWIDAKAQLITEPELFQLYTGRRYEFCPVTLN